MPIPASITDAATSNFAALKCPHCGDTYLHQENVTIYHRAEDARYTVVMAQNGHDMVVTKFPSEEVMNPSSRRHGIVIEFWCEYCNMEYTSVDSAGNETQMNKGAEPLKLAIYQHKGYTFMEWV
jgi:hypothetical protein